MRENNILITAPSLDTKQNVSGISSVANFIISNNATRIYKHFELGRKDDEKRNLLWVFKIIQTTFRWMFVVSGKKIKLVHFNFPLSKAAVLRDAPLILFAKLIRKKMIVHLHGGDYMTSKKATGWMKLILKRVFAGNTQLIVLSPAEEEVIISEYNVKKVKVLPNCVDLREAKIFERKVDKNAVIRLLYIGRISVPKGIEYTYQALALLKKKGIPFKFIIAGTGPDEKEYLEKFSALLGSDFEFKGIVSGDAKTAVFKNADVFVMPSHFEGLPMSLLESMSFGLVPVVTNVGSIKYVVQSGENGIMVDKNPAEEVAEAIEKIIFNRALLQTMSVNAANFIFKHYNPQDYISELNKMYDAA
jgi:glycosyltransferase involved in cell wall biosynthesis